MASVAVASEGLGINDNTVGLRVGRVDIRDVSSGSSVSGGKLARVEVVRYVSLTLG